MNETENEEALKAASINLSHYLHSVIRIIKWNSVEQNNVKDKDSLAKMIERFQGIENMVREKFPQTAELILDSLHYFASKSDLYTIESIAQEENFLSTMLGIDVHNEIIGTSAHHACVMFLQQCLHQDFWKDSKPKLEKWHNELLPKLKQNQLRARLAWERLRVFETSDFPLQLNQDFVNIPDVDKFIKEQEVAKQSDYYHEPTEEPPRVFLDINSKGYGRLRGTMGELAAALDVTVNTFKAWGKSKSIWVIRHSRTDFELLIHNQNKDKVDEYKQRLEQIQASKHE